MQHTILRPKQTLNKAYLRSKTSRAEMEAFKKALLFLLDSINMNESEEHAKNHLRDFLKLAYYDKYGVNTKGKTDLVIHTGHDTKSPAGVLLEVKRPTNKGDMPTAENLNYKAMHELVLYYLRERVEHKNNDLKQLVITSVYEWFVFDALEFDRLFYRNSQLRKDFIEWSQGKKSGNSTDFFYKEIVAPFIAGLSESITFTHFNLKDYEKTLRNASTRDDVKLVALQKLLSPAHLLKEPFANDANSLDKGFYQELLHIIGLEEVKEGGRKLIRRKAKPDHGSLLEAAYQKLRSEDLVSGLDNPYSYGNTREEQLFNVALELCITWMNRVLFLKLLEAQLISYHHGDKKYAFMSTQNLREFDDLNELFFDVLAEHPDKRAGNVRQKYSHIPYLNSSLFETTPLEKHTLRISNLKDRSLLPLYPQTVLRNAQGKSLSKTQPELHTLEYLLRFLGSYDFGAEGKEEIQEENKTLITASVLGLIFEKINGYRDGSFYTPGFITMYMSREAIRRAVVQRFAQKYNWAIDSSAAGTGFEDLQLRIHQNYTLDKLKEYNKLINGLRICDPAVGSGHYLVSALNELIVIKAELRLLLNRQGKPLHYGSIEVQNDELIVTDYNGELFSYTVQQHPDGHRSINPLTQELQETLFHEKQTIIENCLFGVDINPNSVKICRLRLWIELLKNAYYLDQDLQDFKMDRISSQSDSLKSKNPSGTASCSSINPENPGGRGPREDSDNLTSPVCYANTSNLRDGFNEEESWKSKNDPGYPGGRGPREDSGKYTQLQTLPNIDINIKQGNSLLSRYPLTADLHEAFGKKGHSLQAYREAVLEYKHTNSKETKKQLVAFLEEIKQGFKTTLVNNDPLRKKMAELRGQIQVMQNPDLFGAKKVDKKQLQQKQNQLLKLEEEREAIEANKVYEGAFEWRFEFPEVLDEEGKYTGFDVVIGNPPYGADLTKNEDKLYRTKYKVSSYQIDTYTLFIELSNLILKEGGVTSLIIPTAWLSSTYDLKVREYLLDELDVFSIDICPKHTFEEAIVETLILNATKTSPKDELKVSQLASSVINVFNKNKFRSDVNKAFFIVGDSSEYKLINKIKESEIRLENLFDVVWGVKVYEKGKGTPPQNSEASKLKIFHSNLKTKETHMPLLGGKEINSYSIRWIGGYIDYGPWLAAPRNISWFEEGPKLLVREITSKGKIQAAYTNDEYVFSNSVDGIRAKADAEYSIKVLLAILNSKLISFYHQKLSANSSKDAFPKVLLQDLRNLPLLQPDEETKASITSLVEQILSIKKADAAADTSGLEAEIDVLVYRLYNLTYEEVLLVEPGFALSEASYNNLAFQPTLTN
ncbi:MAG: Eco57I restriction-modification methylase domain-containing protein [Pontibacter sp.]|nr:Eco57I restriction-modification methylase domain-containing protein [Pontibacter sp.]